MRQATAAILTLCPSPQEVTLAVHARALQIAERYEYRIFDSLILAAALEANCSTLYTKDMQDGQTIERLTIRNPFVGHSGL